MNIKDSVAIVTGGGNGIGEAVAKYLVKNGAKVAVVDVAPANIDRVVKELKAMGGEVIGIQANVSIEADTAKFVKATVRGFWKAEHYRCLRRHYSRRHDANARQGNRKSLQETRA